VYADRAWLEFRCRLAIAMGFGAGDRIQGRRRGLRHRGLPGFFSPFLANRQPFIYYSQFIHRRKMYIVSSLTRVWLHDEFCILVQDPGKFSRSACCFSRFIGRTLQSFFLAH
jgi:hypothetical protein